MENMKTALSSSGIGNRTFSFLPVWILKLISVNLLLYTTANYK